MDEADDAGAETPQAGKFSPRHLPPAKPWPEPASEPPPPGPAAPNPAAAGSPLQTFDPGTHDPQGYDPASTHVMPAVELPAAAPTAAMDTPGPAPKRRRVKRPADPPGGRRVGALRRPALLGLGLLGAVVVVIAGLWLVDGQATKGTVARNVVLVDRDIGGMDRQEVIVAVTALAERYTTAEVQVEAPDGGFKADGAELGIVVLPDDTADAALDVGRKGFVVTRVWNWLTGFVTSRKAPVVLDVDENAVRRLVAERDPLREPPVEPNIALRDGRLVAVDGRPGRGIDPANVVRALRSDAGQRLPLQVSVPRREVPPRYTIADAERLAAEAETLAVDELPVVIEGNQATVPAATVRTWLRGVPSDDGLRLGIDAEGAAEALSALFPGVGTAAVDAGLSVVSGAVVVTPSSSGTACCAPEATQAIEDALRNRRPGNPPVNLPLKVVPPARTEDAVKGLGITEVIGSFTTNHPAGEPRVTNIHRMADIVEGAIIEPGGTFSLNGWVGERTIAKGFVEAPVIDADYKFSKDVGGGVSQFSTTLFNAAFFAGLDIPTYGMHGIYIARYPYGREATLDFPSLDLKVANPTPHGVLIWPTYSASSITVTLYSTRTVEGAQTNQTKTEIATTEVAPTTTVPPDPAAPTTAPTTPPGPEVFQCTRVVTERTRTYTDGRTSVDRFFALYAPKEGVICPR